MQGHVRTRTFSRQRTARYKYLRSDVYPFLRSNCYFDETIYKHDGRFVGGLISVRFVSKPDFVAYACKPAAQSVKATTVKCMLTIDIFVSTQWRINRIIGCFDESAELRPDKTDVSRVAQSLSIGLRLTTYVLPSCVSVSKRINLLPV